MKKTSKTECRTIQMIYFNGERKPKQHKEGDKRMNTVEKLLADIEARRQQRLKEAQ
jgi:hypothetical protein